MDEKNENPSCNTTPELVEKCTNQSDDKINNIQIELMDIQETSDTEPSEQQEQSISEFRVLEPSKQFVQQPLNVLMHHATLKNLPELSINIIKNPAAHTKDVLVSSDNTEGEALIKFRVEDVDNIEEEKVLSPPVCIRNMQWHIMVMPLEVPNSYPKNLGLFVQCTGGTLTNWWIHAAAELRLLSFTGSKPVTKRIRHTFSYKENDWGFRDFIAFEKLMNSDYMQDGAIEVEAMVVADVPTGISWDSRKFAGYVGIENQGATCYMNSLLQTLFFTNELRRAVFQIPTEADDSSRSVAMGLQGVFYDLQFSERMVGTKNLTKSFGWNTVDSFTQHDVQEFLRVLLDKLESRMRGSSLEGTIPRMFGGQMTSYVKCINVEYTSMRSEMFYDIQLNIRGKKDGENLNQFL